MSAPSFASALLARMPPWLQRTEGAKLMLSLGDTLDLVAGRAIDAVAARFPSSTSDELTIALLGKERRILRGPQEDVATYAGRMRTWLDDHARRGGPRALARQVWGFWRSTLNPAFEIVYPGGRRYSVDTSGNVTRDDIGTSPSDAWARYWIVFHLPGTLPDTTWIDDSGATMADETGAGLVFAALAGGGALDDDTAEAFRSVPREWSPAHVSRVDLLLLYGGAWYLGQPGVTLGDGHTLGSAGSYELPITDL